MTRTGRTRGSITPLRINYQTAKHLHPYYLQRRRVRLYSLRSLTQQSEEGGAPKRRLNCRAPLRETRRAPVRLGTLRLSALHADPPPADLRSFAAFFLKVPGPLFRARTGGLWPTIPGLPPR